MIEFLSSLSPSVLLTLIISMALVLAFEFVNGFHDTANAVATVIYTKSMKPTFAVFLSGIFNFLGVLFGGLAVAYSIVNLLPMDLLASANSNKGLVMVFALLSSALMWNLLTWYFGIPASSSHTLIGSILGVGLANAIINGFSFSDGVNWAQANKIFLSLLLSPFIGGGLAGLFLYLLKKWKPVSYIHKTPHQRHVIEGRKRPPFWPRFVLICSSMGMSFTHGSNDGQKGVGLVMLVLFSVVPANFVVNMQADRLEIETTRLAAEHLAEFYQQHQTVIQKTYPIGTIESTQFNCFRAQPLPRIENVNYLLRNITHYKELNTDQRWILRNELMCLADITRYYGRLAHLSTQDRRDLQTIYRSLTTTTHYAPFWVILSVAFALGIGTMIGWRRVVETVGGKIGKKDMTYAQGISAQTMAGVSIGLASSFGFPVSTTHILSSAVAGTMVANNSGLQMSTIKTILLAWILTLPISMGLSFGLYLLGTQFIN